LVGQYTVLMHLISRRSEVSVQRTSKMQTRQFSVNGHSSARTRLKLDLKLVFILNHHSKVRSLSVKVPWYVKLKGRQRYFVLPEIHNVFNWRRATRNRLCSSNKLFFVSFEYLSYIFRFTFLFLFSEINSLFAINVSFFTAR